MTDDDFPGGVDREVERQAGRPLDVTDEVLLSEVAAMLTDVDPQPEDLVERIRFSLALDEMYAEVARIGRMPADALAVRSEPATGKRTDTLTFSADRLTAMVTVTRSAPERVRVDGWIAPPAAMRILLRMQEGSRETVADELGRFVFDGLPDGFAQLAFHDAEDAERPEDAAVVTPLFQL